MTRFVSCHTLECKGFHTGIHVCGGHFLFAWPPIKSTERSDRAVFGTWIWILVGAVIVLFIAGLLLYLDLGKTGRNTRSSQGRRGRAVRRSGSDHSARPEKNNNPEWEVIRQIRQNDPAFSADDMKRYAKECFRIFCNSWKQMAGENADDTTELRKCATTALFVSQKSAVAMNRSTGVSHVESFRNMISSHLTAYESDEEKEYLTMMVHASYVVYESDREDVPAEATQGVQEDHHFWMKFQRFRGTQTAPDNALSLFQCPCCRAPLFSDTGGVCPFCRSPVSDGHFYWLLESIRRVRPRGKA